MEPDLVTDPEHRDVLQELIDREPIFHRPELGTSRRDFEEMGRLAGARPRRMVLCSGRLAAQEAPS